MSRLQVTLLLAGWEFRRFFKWKSQLISWAIMGAMMVGLALLGPRLFDRAVAETTVVGLVGEAPFVVPETLGVTLRQDTPEALISAYEAEEIGALLSFASDSQGTLRSHSEGGWIGALQASLDAARKQSRLAAHALDPAVLADVNANFSLERVTDDSDSHDEAHGDAGHSGRPSRWDRIIALGMLAFMVAGIFTGTALLFTGITSEKQQLVTEQIVAAVPAQTWIDGKILGIGLRSVTASIEMVLWSMLGMLIWRDFVNPDFAGLEQVSPGLLTLIASMASLGFALWFCVFAAIAASIDDPNTSARGALILLPMLSPVLAVPAWFHPDGALALVLSMLPPTATMAMTVRLVFTEVPAWQIAVALAGMALSIALLRRAAGKVFAMSALMRGKEPSWREMWAAARRA